MSYFLPIISQTKQPEYFFTGFVSVSTWKITILKSFDMMQLKKIVLNLVWLFFLVHIKIMEFKNISSNQLIWFVTSSMALEKRSPGASSTCPDYTKEMLWCNTCNNSSGRSGTVQYVSDMFAVINNACPNSNTNWMWLPSEKNYHQSI